MNKSLLKKFATSMRLELIGSVKNKIEYLLSDNYKDNLALYSTNKTSIEQIRKRYEEDKEDFIEEVAYTWFNRLIALRFMDVNEITSSFVVSTTEEQPIPQIFIDAKAGNIDDELSLDRTKFFDLIDKKISGIKDHDNEAYKLLFIATCNYYSKVMPFMFEAIADYTELLLPDDMLSPNSLRAKVVESVADEDCQDVEVIGWLYQFYIAEKKDEAMAKKSKYKTSEIPAVTQLFTPHWIVKYMVENSLGKLWLLNNPTSSLKDHMKYYIENDEETNSEFIKVNSPEELTFLDPCCGSGHTLTYAFDLLTLIYEEQGYSKSEIPSLILENNLFGCDIDKRASVLANFALTMKARQYHKRFFRKSVTPNIIELQEFGDEFKGIKNYGSLMKPSHLEEFVDGIFSQTNREFELQKKILGSQFHCVVTNPPYMGNTKMTKELSEFVKVYFERSKEDLFACFIDRSLELTLELGYHSAINQHSWMFLSSFEELREFIISENSISSLIHLGLGVFRELNSKVVQSTAFVIQKKLIDNFKGVYIDLKDYKNLDLKEQNLYNKNAWYYSNQQYFLTIPFKPIAYWVKEKNINTFTKKKIHDYGTLFQGMITGNNEKFVRFWYETNNIDILINCKKVEDFDSSRKKWVPYNKGGESVKWYGNQEFIVNFKNKGTDFTRGKAQFSKFFFRQNISWSYISLSLVSRYFPEGFVWDVSGSSVFLDDEDKYNYFLALLNSKVGNNFLKIYNPTLNFQVENIAAVPIVFENGYSQIDTSVNENIEISKEYYDIHENSWKFTRNELIKHKSDDKIEITFENYCNYWKEKFYRLHSNEEELNKLFIEIYELQDELTPEVDLKDITILKQEADIIDGELVFNADEIIKQFISYAVGVMFGRYSLDQDGLVVANLNQDYPKDTTFEIDDDNVIPVLDDEYFSDDIVARFINFVKVTFGEESLSENIKFIEESLGKDLRKYFVKDFYDDHVRRYKKRPIYWMVSSPKKGFMSLIYMHRYTPDIFGRVRNSYLTEYIAKLEAHKETLTLTTQSSTASNKDKKDADKAIKNIDAKLKEIIAFDRDVMMNYAQDGIEIDLDDGVKVNYCKFADILYEFDKKLCK